MKQKYDICAMKYRILSQEELLALEPELKEFLIVNGLDGEAWEQLNREQPDKAIAVVELFSDIVLEKVYKKVQVLEKRDTNNLTLVRVGKSTMELIHVFVRKNESLQILAQATIPYLLQQHRDSLDIYRGKKDFQFTREEEIHRLIVQRFVAVPLQVWEEVKRLLG
jgi:hypothetical protein